MRAVAASLDVLRVRKEFPILGTQVNGKPLVYLDNGATSQKPLAVLNKLDEYWEHTNANIHRGVHHLSQQATSEYDEVRKWTRVLLNARSSREIVFTRGCTESINLVASCLSSLGGSSDTVSRTESWFAPGDCILISNLEHHSNIVPWQMAASRSGAQVKVIPVTDSGEIDLEAYSELLGSMPVKLVAISHISNAIGTINPIREMIEMAHAVGALVLVDGAQAGPHARIDVQKLDTDFYVLACHKMYGPTGVGVLYGKEHLLERMPPYQGGGDMIRTVEIERTTYAGLPEKFEAGTPNIAGVVGFGASIGFLAGIGSSSGPGSSSDERADDRELATALDASFGAIGAHEHALTEYATSALSEIPGLRLLGPSRNRASIVSFVLDRAHPHDIGTILDSEGIAIRTGHHCCQPLMKRLCVPATARASFGLYNTREEVDALVAGVKKVQEIFS